MLGPLGVSSEFCETWVALVVVAFAMTTLDTATRLTRFALTEFAGNYGVKLNRDVATAIPVLVAAALTLTSYGGKTTVMAMWPVFGVTNQLLAVLALLTVTIWLIKLKRPSLYTGIPMAFMLITTVVAAIYTEAIERLDAIIGPELDDIGKMAIISAVLKMSMPYFFVVAFYRVCGDK